MKNREYLTVFVFRSQKLMKLRETEEFFEKDVARPTLTEKNSSVTK